METTKVPYTKVEQLQESLKQSLGNDYDKEAVEQYAAYCLRLKNETDKQGVLKNPWMQKKDVAQLDQLYRRVIKEGIPFDGVHVTLQSTGVSYDYVAYKNKMLIAYPESMVDLQLVYKGDDFNCSKDSGKVIYKHNIANPFDQKDDEVIGGYCVIKNKRGEFLVTLSKEDIAKHRNVAKTDYIWKAWFKEMCLKTVIKKACKFHFQDVYEGIEKIDNDNYNLEYSGKSESEVLSMKILDALDVYQGEDAEEIREMCANKKLAGEFTPEFARNILKQLGHAE